MNTAQWAAQILLAFVMFAAGAMKIVTPRMKLAEKLKWPASWTDANVKLLGLAEVLGAVGLVVPWASGVAPVLTPLAAIGLLIIMAGAVKTHLHQKESPIPAIIFGALCLFVALGRFGII